VENFQGGKQRELLIRKRAFFEEKMGGGEEKLKISKILFLLFFSIDGLERL